VFLLYRHGHFSRVGFLTRDYAFETAYTCACYLLFLAKCLPCRPAVFSVVFCVS
jgi:hypothetical protein